MANAAVALEVVPSAPRFPKLVEDAVAAMWPAEVAARVPTFADGLVEEVGAGFHELEHIHENHARYNLGWAFTQARQRFGAFYDTAVERYEQSGGSGTRNAGEEHVDVVARRGLRALAWSSRIFSLLSLLVSLVDIVISVVLILAVSRVSHYTDSFIGSATVGLLVVALVALLKVTLDRFVIIPVVHRWGWQRFGGALSRNKRILSNLLAVGFVVREISSRGHGGDISGVRKCCLGRLKSCLGKKA